MDLPRRRLLNLHSISDHESNHIASAETPHPLLSKKYNDELSFRYEKEPVVIAHAISLIKCSKGPSVAGFLDAAAVLRHLLRLAAALPSPLARIKWDQEKEEGRRVYGEFS